MKTKLRKRFLLLLTCSSRSQIPLDGRLSFGRKGCPALCYGSVPISFFFKNGQFIGKDRVWYNQNYDENAWNRFPKSAADFNKQANLIRRRIKAFVNHPLLVPLKASLLLINEGMTSDDLAFRLMRFWSAAEALYAPDDDKTSSKKLISRLTFASKSDEWLDKIKLERCYHLRNMYVHRGSNDNDDTSLVQHLRELLLQQVYYYLLHGQDIASHSDLLMMVDLPTEESALERRRLAIDRRLNIARSGRHRV
jgi:Apea-like HEPN